MAATAKSSRAPFVSLRETAYAYATSDISTAEGSRATNLPAQDQSGAPENALKIRKKP
jgi:hypothetical protein